MFLIIEARNALYPDPMSVSFVFAHMLDSKVSNFVPVVCQKLTTWREGPSMKREANTASALSLEIGSSKRLYSEGRHARAASWTRIISPLPAANTSRRVEL